MRSVAISPAPRLTSAPANPAAVSAMHPQATLPIAPPGHLPRSAAPANNGEVIIPPPWNDPGHPYWSNKPMTRLQTATVLLDAASSALKMSSMLDNLVAHPELRTKPEAWDAAARVETDLTTTLLLGRDSLVHHLPGELTIDPANNRRVFVATALGMYAQDWCRLGGKARMVADGLRQGIDGSKLVLGNNIWQPLEGKTSALAQAAANLLREGKPPTK